MEMFDYFFFVNDQISCKNNEVSGLYGQSLNTKFFNHQNCIFTQTEVPPTEGVSPTCRYCLLLYISFPIP